MKAGRMFLLWISLASLCHTADLFNYDEELQKSVIESTIQLSDWLRKNYGDLRNLDAHTTSRIMVALRLAGHQPSTLLSDYKYTSLTILDYFKIHLDKDLAGMPVGEIANINLAFLALCSSPQKVTGYNLTQLLEEKLGNFQKPGMVDFTNFFQYSIVALAVCETTWKQEEGLVDKIVSEFAKGYAQLANKTDTTSMAIMALCCLRQKTDKQIKKVDKMIHKYLKYILVHLKSKEQWNIHKMSLVAQALMSLPPELKPKHYSKYLKGLIKDILKVKDVTGSFGNILANTEVLPVLAGRSLVHLGDMHCPQEDKQKVQSQKKKISVCIKLSFDWEPADRYFWQINLTVSENTTAMEILNLASRINDVYHYEVKESPYGRMVTAISDHHQDNRYYWSLYENTTTTPAAFGVDAFIPKNNTCIIFRYETIASEDAAFIET